MPLGCVFLSSVAQLEQCTQSQLFPLPRHSQKLKKIHLGMLFIARMTASFLHDMTAFIIDKTQFCSPKKELCFSLYG